MKFTSFTLATAVLASPALAFVVPGPTVQLRAGSPGDRPCDAQRADEGQYNGGFSQACVGLVDDCIKTLNATETHDLWTQRSCVAAATCDGMLNLYDLAAFCSNVQHLQDPASLNSLDYNLYASIVGDCAWQDGGCPITQQNYVDFLYGSLSNIGSTVWPNISQVDTWWTVITNWTATGETVPYLNFNDWLHYSSLR